MTPPETPEMPATPTQLAASGAAATAAVAPDPAPVSGLVERLHALLQAVRARRAAWATLLAAGAEPADLPAEWTALHESHGDALAAALAGLGRAPDAPPGEVAAGLRAAATRLGLRDLAPEIRAENALIDRYTDMARSDPEHRTLLDEHRAAIVALANRTQDRLDP